MVLAEFSMSPLDKGDSLSQYVARSLDIIDKSGLPYQLTPMGTIVEGEWDEVMALVTACYKRMNQDCNRISTSIKIDYRAGKSGRLKSKIQAIESKLGRTLSKYSGQMLRVYSRKNIKERLGLNEGMVQPQARMKLLRPACAIAASTSRASAGRVRS